MIGLFVFLFFVGLQIVTAQTKQVTGTVTSADDGLGMPGVSVVIKGTTIGSSTNIDGQFTVTAKPADVLVFSFVGMVTQEIPVGNKTIINVVMQSESIGVDEVVVTAMGISREKKALGYAATSVGGDEISKAQMVNPMNALQGKVAGVDISTAPGPGATQNVIIRGASSFGNNQPLYIVDGVPITNEQNRRDANDDLNAQVDFGSGINAINPDDIEDMTVLKGAAATALYGSRASNGVVMITTKSGSDTGGKVKIAYDGGITISRVSRLPLEQKQFGQGWSGDRALDENGNWGAPYDGKDRVWGNIVDNSQKIKPYKYLENRVREFYEFGKNIKNSVSLRGGTAETNFFLSLSQNSVDGVIPTDQDSYDRYTVATKGSHKAGKLMISSSVNFSTEKTKAVASGQGQSLLRSVNEIAGDISIIDFKNYNDKFNNLDNYFTPYGVNPYFVLAKNGAEQLKNKIFGKFQLDYDIVDNLKLSYRFGGDYETTQAETHTARISFTPGSINDLRGGPVNTGDYEEVRRARTQLNHDFMATFSGSLNEDFSLNVIAGLNVNERKYDWLSGKITSIDVPEFYQFDNSLSPSVADQYKEKRRLVGVYANADLSYRNYAYLTLTARNDWSSTLPLEANSYFYPGITTSFLVTDYLKSNDIDPGVLSFAKVRAAYGMTGNDADIYYIYDRFVSATSGNTRYPDMDDLSFPLNGVNSYTVSDRLGNPELQPELTKEFEVGSEIRLFNSRFGIDISYYNRLTEGLIDVLRRDPSSGYSFQIDNLGDVRNKGIELVVDGTPLKTKDFSWNISVNFARNTNVVERLDIDEVFLGGFGDGGIYAVEGKALGQFKLNKVEEVEIDGEIYTVVDGDGMPIPTTDQVFLGKDYNEKYRLGLTNTINWKGLSLGATLDFRYGGSIYSYTKDYMHWTGSSPESVLNDRNPFLVPNSVVSNGDGTYSENTVRVNPTALHTFYSNGGFEGMSYSILDRSYLKLRNVSMAYNLPSSLCKRIGVNTVSLSLTANNILLWTPVENQYIDPETTTFGNDVAAKFGEFGALPSNEFYSFGLTFTL